MKDKKNEEESNKIVENENEINNSDSINSKNEDNEVEKKEDNEKDNKKDNNNDTSKIVKELQENLEKKEEEAKNNYDKYMRTLAEYDNFRKRTQKEKCDMYDKGIIDTVSGFLDVIDNFDRALNGINKDELDDKHKAVFNGIEMIKVQMDKALDKIGIKAIDAVGKEFDPNMHNAVMHIEDESLGENIVSEELQKGYMYNDKVVRYSIVKVAN